jgi:hypothetical protein
VCIKREALLSGLVFRVTNEAYLITEKDIDALAGVGIEAAAIRAAFEAGAGPAFEHARAVVASTLARRG